MPAARPAARAQGFRSNSESHDHASGLFSKPAGEVSPELKRFYCERERKRLYSHRAVAIPEHADESCRYSLWLAFWFFRVRFAPRLPWIAGVFPTRKCGLPAGTIRRGRCKPIIQARCRLIPITLRQRPSSRKPYGPARESTSGRTSAFKTTCGASRMPHPEERRLRRVSKTSYGSRRAQVRAPHHEDRSLLLDAAGLDQLRPLLLVLVDESGIVLRRARRDLGAVLRQLLLDFVGGKRVA